MNLVIKEFFDKATWTLSYVVSDRVSRDALVIDPVWDYDPAASRMSTESVDKLISYIDSEKLHLRGILETHAHADHVSGSQVLKARFPSALVAIGAGITNVQSTFKSIFNLDPTFPTDGRQFDRLLEDGEVFKAGSIEVKTLFTPGHTPACSSYVIGDAVFTGDALFMPDYGTGRCDFPMGSAKDLYHSVHEVLYKLPDHFKVFVGHDYQPQGRELRFMSTIGEEKAQNIQLKSGTSCDNFVEFRQGRDKGLSAPRLLLPSIQVNIDAGHLPEAEGNGVSYLKIPVRSKP